MHRFYYFLLILLLLSSHANGQYLYPELKSSFKGISEEQVEQKANTIYNQEIKKGARDKQLLALWKFDVIDSIGSRSTADSLALILVKQPINKEYFASARVYYRVANRQADDNQFEKAIQNYHEGLKVSEKIKDRPLEALFRRQIGSTYLKLDQNSTAEDYLRRAFSLYEQERDTSGMAGTAMSLGNALKEQSKYKEAEETYKLSLELAQKINNKRLQAGNYNNIGNVKRRTGNKEEALEYFFKAMEMNIQSNNQLWLSFNYNNIGNVYNDLKDHNKAIEYFKKSNAIKMQMGDSLALMASFQGMSEAYAALHDYRNAYGYLKRFTVIKDTLGLVEQAELLRDLEAKYEAEKSELEIERLKTSEQLQEEINNNLQLEADKNWKLALMAILGGIILMIGVVALLRSNKLKRKTNDLLQNKNQEIEESNDALKNALSELSKKNMEIIDSINYATYIQRASLPDITQQSSKELNFELFFSPKDIVSGDFYFSHHLFNRSVFGVADCTGHGVPGAMVSLVAMNLLDKVIREEKHQNASEMVESLNDHVNQSLYRGNESINDGMDISFCFLEHNTRTLHFTGANQDAYILRSKNKFDRSSLNDQVTLKKENDDVVLVHLAGARRPVGKTYSNATFMNVTFTLEKGDRIILFSDGYADQMGGMNGKKLKKSVLMDLILKYHKVSSKEQVQYLRDYFERWKGTQEQIDDVCLLIVEY